MKTSEQWLREWAASEKPLDALADQLTMAGLEVDAISAAAPDLDGVVVGRIEACEAHPKADRLKVCDVNIGGPQRHTIVCGAPNATAGVLAPVATVGSRLANGLEIEAATIRGQSSHGMLCSASELGLGSDADGLWLLPPDAEPGQRLDAWLGLPDAVLDIDLTPNRGDCLSVRGIAREIAVAEGTALREPAFVEPPASVDIARRVTIDAPTQCAGYGARCVLDVSAGAATPTWLTERLRRSGVRHINLPVDIGNYVMLALGQPMHAFDADKLVGAICVRLARPGETIVTLDAESVTLAEDTLVIADDNGPVAIAGTIGGQRTAVDATTTSVVFEAACFTPAAVAGRGRHYRIHTESLHRFERGVDPELHPVALAWASALLLELGGGHAGPPVVEAGAPLWPARRGIDLYGNHVERLLGQRLEGAWIEQALCRLGNTVEARADGVWRVEPPSWRFDLNIEADLVEELARLYGYDRLMAGAGSVEIPPPRGQAEHVVDAQHIDTRLCERGYSEAITYSFVEPGLHERLTGAEPAVALVNPIAEQYSEMRRTLWAGLLPAWHYNARRQQERIRLFERGLRFVPDAGAEHGIRQVATVAGVAGGRAAPRHWSAPPRNVDFFDIKGDVEALLTGAGEAAFVPEPHPALHPGRCARIYLGQVAVGWLGQLAPEFSKIYKNIELPYLFELNYDALVERATVRAAAVSEQPSVRRDLAVVVAEQMPVAALIAAIHDVRSELLQSIEVFDLFRGQGLDKGFKSIALGLIFQDKASTLKDEQIEEVTARMIAELGRQCGATIRGDDNGGTD